MDVCRYLCTFDITQKHGPVSRHVDGGQYETAAAAVVVWRRRRRYDGGHAGLGGRDDERGEFEDGDGEKKIESKTAAIDGVVVEASAA